MRPWILAGVLGLAVGYAARRAVSSGDDTTAPIAVSRGDDGARATTRTSAARTTPPRPPPRANLASRRQVKLDDPHLLLSREEVDRDLYRGIATNAMATRLVHDARRQLFDDASELSLADCFERAAVPPPESVALELDIQSWADEVRLVELRAPDLPEAVAGCLRELVGDVRKRPEGGGEFLPAAATVRLTVPIGLPLGE